MTKIEKFSKRVKEVDHPVILERINSLESLDYEVYGHTTCSFDPDYPVFTILLTLHDADLHYISESIKSIQGQSYANTEVILIDNGSTGAVSKFVEENFLANKKFKLLRVALNQYSPKDGDRNPLVDLWNAGLFVSVGDFVFFQSYDDLLSPNYVKSMVELFEENPKCVSASPLVSSIDAKGELNIEITKSLISSNSRGRYESGVYLAENRMKGISLINAPGGLLAQKSASVINLGGFDSMNDLTQIFRFAIYGEVGFEPRAMLYWRHHDLQTNKIQTRMGISYYREFLDLSERYNLFEVHTKVAGSGFAEEFRSYINAEASRMAVDSIRHALYRFGHKSGNKALILLIKQADLEVIARGVYTWAIISIHLLLRRNLLVRKTLLRFKRFLV